jgi:Asp-tRNA(Asn)/Glu-tRNA(Gln) amidotransferase A subunit family amidase
VSETDVAGLLTSPATVRAALLRGGEVSARELTEAALARIVEGDDGLPLTVQIVGRPAGEATLLSLASQLERARPWEPRVAPLAQSGQEQLAPSR